MEGPAFVALGWPRWSCSGTPITLRPTLEIRPSRRRTAPAIVAVIASGVAACSGSNNAADAGLFSLDAAHAGDADASPEAAPGDAGAMVAEAGADAARNASCTPLNQETGTAINSHHGRLDGTLVYVLPVGGSKTCNGDESHVHLQIAVSGDIYDVAVDIGSASGGDVGYDEQSFPMPGGAWAEGWHSTDSLTYPSLGLHSTAFTTTDPATMAAKVESLLAGVSRISIFCVGYSQGDGCHDVHYEDGAGNDGAIVLDPDAASPSILFLRFTDQTF